MLIDPEDEMDWRADIAWAMATGYGVECIRCQQVMLIAESGPSNSLICEDCDPTED